MTSTSPTEPAEPTLEDLLEQADKLLVKAEKAVTITTAFKNTKEAQGLLRKALEVASAREDVAPALVRAKAEEAEAFLEIAERETDFIYEQAKIVHPSTVHEWAGVSWAKIRQARKVLAEIYAATKVKEEKKE